jgi:hypothetical protein
MSESASHESAIWVLSLEDTTDRALVDRARARLQRGKVKPEELKERLSEFLGSMQSVLERVPEKLGDFTVDSVDLSLEVTATGKVSLLGTGGELGGSGGITITLTRRSASDPARK